jgi:small subunit ribosomal protein S11
MFMDENLKSEKKVELGSVTVADQGVKGAAEKESANSLLIQEGLEDGLKIKRAKGSKNVTVGVCHILASFNNTKVAFSDVHGNVLAWSSAGRCNFKGSRKSTAYAAQVVTTEAAKIAMGHGLKEIAVEVKGPGMGRDSAIRTLQTLGLTVLSIKDVTPVPHNGCRPPKRRRV